MSDTDEMVRLMNHAADLLDEARDGLITHHAGTYVTFEVAANANAAATLRLVAASVAPAATGTELIAEVLNEMVVDGYDSWAELHQRHTLVTGELTSVADYLRWRVTRPTSPNHEGTAA